jgi:transposase
MAELSRTAMATGLTIGIDLGDKYSQVCIVDEAGEVTEESRLQTTKAAIDRRFSGMERARIAFEAGTHSPWMQRLLEGLGHDVIVANAAQVRLIAGNDRKNDRLDAERLARLARVDPRLLSPVQHRSEEVQADRAVLRSRDVLVRCRTTLINHTRGVVKAMGFRLRSCSARSFHKYAPAQLPEELRPAVMSVIATIADLTRRIREYDRRIEQLCQERYAETDVLRQVPGVGPLTALGYVLRVEDPTRFSSSSWGRDATSRAITIPSSGSARLAIRTSASCSWGRPITSWVHSDRTRISDAGVSSSPHEAGRTRRNGPW